jgi:riboflavin kinase/FMN adenylyltransferase
VSPTRPGCGARAAAPRLPELVRGLRNLRPAHRGTVATIGNYDGVHRGHQHMLAAVRSKADELGLPATVITFEPTPREYFEGAKAPARLMRLREKVEALGWYGIDRVVVLRFDDRMRNTSAAEFEQELLHDGLGVRHMVIGHDFHYARKREGNLASLRAAGERYGFTVEEVGQHLVAGDRVSSSLVREALGRHDLVRAEALLGRPYRMTGRVRRGAQLGRKLGYPTANLALHRKVVPLWGIFAVRVSGAGLDHHRAVVSLGTRPTVNGTDPLLEVHLFDFDGDLYGQYLSVDFVQWLRAEHRFESLDALVAQMHIDAAQARAVLD